MFFPIFLFFFSSIAIFAKRFKVCFFVLRISQNDVNASFNLCSFNFLHSVNLQEQFCVFLYFFCLTKHPEFLFTRDSCSYPVAFKLFSLAFVHSAFCFGFWPFTVSFILKCSIFQSYFSPTLNLFENQFDVFVT